jgi:hypothetical protein
LRETARPLGLGFDGAMAHRGRTTDLRIAEMIFLNTQHLKCVNETNLHRASLRICRAVGTVGPDILLELPMAVSKLRPARLC